MTHVRGIVSIMTQMGPPTLDDELDIQLALDNYGAVVRNRNVVPEGHKTRS